ncbi:MAG: glycogen debranching enzyme, partial [Chloroflexi bacterium]
SINEADSAPFVFRSIVQHPHFDWGGDRRPDTPLHESVIYEAHVKGMTKCHPEVPEELRGTYAGLAHPAIVQHLTSLGVTAVELMPVHQFVHDHRLVEQGLRNYWGYNTIGFFAPHNEYAASGNRGEQVNEFKYMVRTLHEAGIEVILDVVYNHTAEGNHLGPTLCFKGIDNRAYYRLVGKTPEYYYDTTGTGNSLNVQHPHTLQLIMDSLRYWVTEMHVDGFRFDLAATLAREFHEVDRLSTFFDMIQQDPVINRVKLIAEPWDIGEGGYQVGNFPALWSEWNGKYRDRVRDFWRGEPSTVGELASRLTGSSDLYQNDTRRPVASVNFVTAHDGFTLRDLVSYNQKHSEANGEGNADGESNLLATLFLSQGVPMLSMGDELGRTQRGNNNAYCQDNEISWVDWSEIDHPLLEYVRRLIAFRRTHPMFRRRRWFQGRPIRGAVDIAWFKPNGEVMSDQDWVSRHARALGVYLNGRAIPGQTDQGRPIADDSFRLLFNGHRRAVYWQPAPDFGAQWKLVLDTGALEFQTEPQPAGGRVMTRARTVVVLEATEPG